MTALDRVARRLYERRTGGWWPPPEPEAEAWRDQARVSVNELADTLLAEKTGEPE